MAEFKYQEPFPLEKDTTEYRLLTKDYVKTVECDGRKILKIEKEDVYKRQAYNSTRRTTNLHNTSTVILFIECNVE